MSIYIYISALPYLALAVASTRVGLEPLKGTERASHPASVIALRSRCCMNVSASPTVGAQTSACCLNAGLAAYTTLV